MKIDFANIDKLEKGATYVLKIEGHVYDDNLMSAYQSLSEFGKKHDIEFVVISGDVCITEVEKFLKEHRKKGAQK